MAYRVCQYGRYNKIAAPSKTIPHIAHIWGYGMEGVLQKNFWRLFSRQVIGKSPGLDRETGFGLRPSFMQTSLQRAAQTQKKDDARWASSGLLLSGKRDSNPRPSAWEADALPTELFPHCAYKCNNFFISVFILLLF